MMTLTKKLFLTLGFGALISFVGLAAVFVVMIYQGSNEGPEANIMIQSGMSLQKVSTYLADNEIIRHPTLMKWLLRLSQGERRVRVGEFRFRRGMRVSDAVQVLYYAEPVLHPITIPEGWTIKQIGFALSELKLIDAEKFYELTLTKAAATKYGIHSENLEGYLFPDTYAFSKLDGEAKIVDMMVKRFMAVWDEAIKAKAEVFGWPMEKVTNLASIIEKETGLDGERNLISSVFHNRIKKKMRLESDPTTIYGIENFDGNLKRADLRRYSPFNTYVIRGLPLTPIANPGRASLLAVLEPTPSEYLFFVANNQGGHIFSRTYQEHTRHVNSTQKSGIRNRAKTTKNGRKP